MTNRKSEKYAAIMSGIHGFHSLGAERSCCTTRAISGG